MISVITPTYNRPDFLKQAIESFIMQDYQDKEMIIVDDGSDADYSGALKYNGKPIEKYGITYIKFEVNNGCPSSLNEGIKESQGEFICILADDDLFNGVDSLTRRVNSFTPSGFKDTEVIYTGAYAVDVNDKILSEHRAEPVDKNKIFQKDYINIQSMMWRRGIHDRIGYFSEDLINNEDWEWKIRCLYECNVKAVDIVSVRSRYHGGNKSLVNRSDTQACADKLIKRMKEQYK